MRHDTTRSTDSLNDLSLRGVMTRGGRIQDFQYSY